MDARDILLTLAVRNEGNFNKTYRDIQNKNLPSEEEVLKTKNEYKGKFITFLDENYPKALKMQPMPPFVLFYKGNIDLLNKENIVCVACKRNYDDLDEKHAKELLENDLDLTYLIGGTKFGLDEKVKDFGKPTIVVLPRPIEDGDARYFDNCDLLISEYPNGVPVRQEFFSRRNSIMASLLNKLLVINCRQLSGTLMLVNTACCYNKDVLVVPKTIEQDSETINFELIGEGAYAITSTKELAL